MIPQSFIQDLLARGDIVEVIERYLPLKKGGVNYFACCPFHGEKSPSFSVSPSKQFYHCFGCGAHGSAIGFLMEYSGLDFVEAVKDLAQQVGMVVPEESRTDHQERVREQSLSELMTQAARFYKEQLKRSPTAIEYLKKRGLTGAIAARYGLGYAPEGWQGLQAAFADYSDPRLEECGLILTNDQGRRYDRFRERIMFPIQDQRGHVIGFGGRVLGKGEPKYLNSPETPLFEKGRELYGLPQARQEIRDRSCVLVVEGYMDVVALAQFGVHNAVATLGTAATAHHLQKLMRMADQVVFCFDGDAAGQRAAARALDVSLEHLADDKRVSFLFLPEEHDPDSYVRQFGADAFRAAMDQARPLADFLLEQLSHEIDLNSAEGRARLVHDAKARVLRISAPLLRLQVMKRLAEMAGFTQQEVEQAYGLDGRAALPSAPPSGFPPDFDGPPPDFEGAARYDDRDFSGGEAPTGRRFGGRQGGGQNGKWRGRNALPKLAPRQRPPSSIEKLIKVLTLHPTWTARLPIDLLPDDSPEGRCLIAMVDAMSVGELPIHGGVGSLLEHFRDTGHAEVLARIASQFDDEAYGDSLLEPLFNDTLNKLEADALELQINRLTQQSRLGGLGPEERRQLSELLLHKSKLRVRTPPANS
ncbi:MAG: DNA primase [Rhodocyclales bacterium]|nr:DNA primase [Rhodocyclales bacterium]